MTGEDADMHRDETQKESSNAEKDQAAAEIRWACMMYLQEKQRRQQEKANKM